MSDFQNIKTLVSRFYDDLDRAAPAEVAGVLDRYTGDDYLWRGVHPFNELDDAHAVARVFWEPLRRSIRPLQRREDIFIAGRSEIDGREWVMSMGHLAGLLDEGWLGIRPTGKLVFLRYADFNCVRDGKIVETGSFCDIIGLMRQAGLNPLPVETGAEIRVPGPRTRDGLLRAPQAAAQGLKTLALVNRMKDDLIASYGTEVKPELLAQTWHDDMLWYGPSGIGSTYTIDRYQRQHQWPFRRGLDGLTFNGHVSRFAEGHYAAWFGWPNLTATPTGGFLGLPGSERRIDMRVVDVYRRAGDKLAENWVLIDLLHWLSQQGIDVLDRMNMIGSFPDAS